MTCIAAIQDDEGIWIGADSAGVSGFALSLRADPKIYEIPGFVFGFTSSFRMGQLLGYSLVPPPRADGCSLQKYMATAFVDAVRECLKKGGYAKKENEVETGGTFLVIHDGVIFTVDSDFQVGVSMDGFDACGCGQDIARASLYTTSRRLHSNSPIHSRERLQIALDAAEHYSIGVRGPFRFVRVER